LRTIPDTIQQEVVNQFETSPQGDRSKILNYMINNRLKNLIENIGEF
jgi:hypothetical protein